jgi:hypothetical protein
MWKKTLAAWISCGLAVASALAADFKVGAIEIEHPWTWSTPAGAKVGGAFMVLHNRGNVVDRLVGVSAPIASTAEIHDHITENGVMRMRAIPGITIEPGKSVTLKPGSFHLMFFGLKQTPKPGEKFPVSLEFEKAGKTVVMVEVESRSKAHQHGDSGHKH